MILFISRVLIGTVIIEGPAKGGPNAFQFPNCAMEGM